MGMRIVCSHMNLQSYSSEIRIMISAPSIMVSECLRLRGDVPWQPQGSR